METDTGKNINHPNVHYALNCDEAAYDKKYCRVNQHCCYYSKYLA